MERIGLPTLRAHNFFRLFRLFSSMKLFILFVLFSSASAVKVSADSWVDVGFANLEGKKLRGSKEHSLIKIK